MSERVEKLKEELSKPLDVHIIKEEEEIDFELEYHDLSASDDDIEEVEKEMGVKKVEKK